MYWIVEKSSVTGFLPVASEIITNIGSWESRIVKIEVTDRVFHLLGARHDAFFRFSIPIDEEVEDCGDGEFYIDLYDLVNVVDKIDGEKLVFEIVEDKFYVRLLGGKFYFDVYNMEDTYLASRLSEDVDFKLFERKAEMMVAHPFDFPLLNKLLSLSIKDVDKKLYIHNSKAYFHFATAFGRIDKLDFCDSILDMTALKIMAQLHSRYSFSFFESNDDYLISFSEDSYVVFSKELDDEVMNKIDSIDERLDKVVYVKVDTPALKKLSNLYDSVNNYIDAKIFNKKDKLIARFFSRGKEISDYEIGVYAGEDIKFEVPVNTLSTIMKMCQDSWEVCIMGMENEEKEKIRFVKIVDKVEFVI